MFKDYVKDMLYVICYMLYVICYVLCVICYMLYVICYILYVMCNEYFSEKNKKIYIIKKSKNSEILAKNI